MRLLFALFRLAVGFFLLALLIFMVLDLLPGDSASLMLGVQASPETLAELRRQTGLDLPVWRRFLDWFVGVLGGDFGTSLAWHVPVIQLILDRAAVSLPLAGMALVLTLILAFPAGFFAARARTRTVQSTTLGILQIAAAIPNFWFGLILITLFALGLKLFPASGFVDWSNGWRASLHALFLPALALALPQAALLARVLRGGLVDAMTAPFMRAARARGLSKTQCLLKHAMPHAMMQVLTIIGLQAAFLIAGTLIIETVFNLPGIGRLALQALSQRDVTTVRAIVLILAATVMGINFLVDNCYPLIDPRLRRRAGVS